MKIKETAQLVGHMKTQEAELIDHPIMVAYDIVISIQLCRHQDHKTFGVAAQVFVHINLRLASLE